MEGVVWGVKSCIAAFLSPEWSRTDVICIRAVTIAQCFLLLPQAITEMLSSFNNMLTHIAIT